MKPEQKPLRWVRPSPSAWSFAQATVIGILGVAGSRLETAIVPEDDVADPDDARPTFHMVCHRLRMLDHHIGMGDGARNQNLARRELDALDTWNSCSWRGLAASKE